MMNPLSETKNNGALAIVGRNIREHPMFPVKFDGRFFEVKSFYIWPTDVNNQTMFSPWYQMYRGEINLNSFFPIIIVREFSKGSFDEIYDSFDEALNKAFQKLKDYKFDEMKDLKYELHYRFE